MSAYHEHIHGTPAGQHPQVCALMSGVFNKKPPQPRYTTIWDIQVVLNHIKTNWADSKLLSDKQLTYKVTILLAFTSASRASTIHHLDTRFMTRTDNRYQFTFHKIHKSWRREKPSPTIEFYGFKEDKELCIVTTLDEYLNRTRTWHNNESKTQLLLSHVKSHAEVTSST